MRCLAAPRTNGALTARQAFNPLEWQQYAAWDPEHFTRVLLASSPYYSMVLSCWDRGQFSPVHDHAGSRNWIKVLQVR